MYNTSEGAAEPDFVKAARDEFAFLIDHGFRETESSSPSLVRWGKGALAVDLCHEQLSDEVDLGVSWHGHRFSLSEVIRAVDPGAAKAYRSESATKPAGMKRALANLRDIVVRYGGQALQGDERYFAILEVNRKSWSENCALEVRARQLRPQAESAFRLGDYLKAVELYEQFEPSLSPIESKKVALARKRLAGDLK